MTMLRLKPRQRGVLSETFRELANLSAGAMVLGQFVGERPFSPLVLLAGAGMWIALVVLSLFYARDE